MFNGMTAQKLVERSTVIPQFISSLDDVLRNPKSPLFSKKEESEVKIDGGFTLYLKRTMTISWESVLTSVQSDLHNGLDSNQSRYYSYKLFDPGEKEFLVPAPTYSLVYPPGANKEIVDAINRTASLPEAERKRIDRMLMCSGIFAVSLIIMICIVAAFAGEG